MLPTILQKPVTRGAELARGVAGGWTWGPAVAVAKHTIISTLSKIEIGTLLLIDEPCGSRHVFGQKLSSKTTDGGVEIQAALPRKATTTPRVELVVKNEAFWLRLFLFADMGFSEAFMLGDVECEDLTSFFQLFIVNRSQLDNGSTWISSISSTVSSIARSTNTLSNALLNISAHYDISNDMFAAFLSPDMTYSCPIWELDAEVDESLEKAQMRKLQRFIDGARIKPTDHVLEIGTGWGSFAIEAVRQTGCRVTSLTLSKEQKALAEERIHAAGFTDRIDVQLRDYRALPTPNDRYDKIVSIEMLEAVGEDYLSTYFECIDKLLKKNGGIAMLQCITMPDSKHESYSKSVDFINHYIFPGGYLPSSIQLLGHITKASKGTLIVEKVENIGGHYTKALRLWRESFEDNFAGRIRPALLKQHPQMTEQQIEVFRRKWEYYFAYSEAGFLSKTLGDVIITVGREGALELMEGIPL